jgi:MFS family permease
MRDIARAPTRRVLAAAHARPKHRSGGLSARESWRLLRSPVILRNLFFFLLLAFASSGMWSFTIVALGALYQTPLSVASMALTVYLVMAALGVLAGGVIADRTRRHALVAALGLAIGGAAILAVATVGYNIWLLIPAMIVAGLMNGVIQPSRDMIVRSVTPPGSVGKVFGFVTAGFNIGGVIGPLVYAFMMDHGSPRAVFLTVAALSLISLATVMMPASRAPVVVPAE